MQVSMTKWVIATLVPLYTLSTISSILSLADKPYLTKLHWAIIRWLRSPSEIQQSHVDPLTFRDLDDPRAEGSSASALLGHLTRQVRSGGRQFDVFGHLTYTRPSGSHWNKNIFKLLSRSIFSQYYKILILTEISHEIITNKTNTIESCCCTLNQTTILAQILWKVEHYPRRLAICLSILSINVYASFW